MQHKPNFSKITSHLMSWHMQLLGKVGVEMCGKFNASVAIERTIGALLPTLQRNLAITIRSQAILSKNVLFVPRTVKLMLIRLRLVLLLLLVLIQLVINLLLLQRWFNR